MIFEWDPETHARNVALRGIPFEVVERLAWETALIVNVSRTRDDEPRFMVLGYIDDRLHAVVYTPRPPAMRIISVRHASRKERAFYATQTKSGIDR